MLVGRVAWLQRPSRAGAVALLLAASIGCAPAPSAVPPPDSGQGSTYAEPVIVRSLPGELPADLPVTLPLPPGGEIVGTIEYERGLTYVTLHARGPIPDLATLYRGAIEAQGWRAVPWVDDLARGRVMFCHPAGGPPISLVVQLTREVALKELVEVGVGYDTRSVGRCMTDEERQRLADSTPPFEFVRP